MIDNRDVVQIIELLFKMDPHEDDRHHNSHLQHKRNTRSRLRKIPFFCVISVILGQLVLLFRAEIMFICTLNTQFGLYRSIFIHSLFRLLESTWIHVLWRFLDRFSTILHGILRKHRGHFHTISF